MNTRSVRRGFTLIEVLIVVAIMGVLLAIAVPAFRNAREGAQAKGCQGNLREILSAKERWAMANNKAASDSPTTVDLTPFYTRSAPVCPAGGSYTIGTLNDVPVCSVGGVRGDYNAHVLP